MNISKTGVCTLLALVITFSSSAQIAPVPVLQKELHRYLKAIQARKNFSGEVLLAKGEDILFQEAAGLASVEHQLELKPGATYRIASITKTFTAALVAIAQEERKLDFNDKILLYCKGVSETFSEITIHQLLTHTSGLPHNEAIPDYWNVKSKLQMTDAQFVDEINQLELLFQPGTTMKYSSLGYYLLALILEEVYNKEFHSILEEKITGKLQLTASGTPHALEIIPGMAAGYHLVNDDTLVRAPYRNYDLVKGAGDMVATSTDLLKWSSSFYSNSLLNDQTKALIFTPEVIAAQTDRERCGYGWFVADGKPKKYFHGGGTWGYSSYIAFYPEDSISLIILSNVSSLPVESIANELEKIVWGLPFSIPEEMKEVPLDTAGLDMYSNRFVSVSGKRELQIIKRGGKLFAQLSGNPAFEIYPKGNHQFFGKKIDILFTFDVTDGIVHGVSAERMGQVFHFKKD